MKVAIYYSGRVEHAKAAYLKNKEQILQIGNKYNVMHFASLNESVNSNEFIEIFKNDFGITEDQINIEKTIVPSDIQELKIPVSGKLNNMFSMFYHNMKSLELIKKYQEKHNCKFDIVVKYRADIFSGTPLAFPTTVKENTIYIPDGSDWGGINDQIAFGDFSSMQKYSDCVLQFQDLGQSIRRYHPESILKAYLKKSNLSIQRFKFDYTLHK